MLQGQTKAVTVNYKAKTNLNDRVKRNISVDKAAL